MKYKVTSAHPYLEEGQVVEFKIEFPTSTEASHFINRNIIVHYFDQSWFEKLGVYPEFNTSYFFINEGMNISEKCWQEDAQDIGLFKSKNFFFTRKGAETKLEEIKKIL